MGTSVSQTQTRDRRTASPVVEVRESVATVAVSV